MAFRIIYLLLFLTLDTGTYVAQNNRYICMKKVCNKTRFFNSQNNCTHWKSGEFVIFDFTFPLIRVKLKTLSQTAK